MHPHDFPAGGFMHMLALNAAILNLFNLLPLSFLDGGKLVRYGAKTVPYGGWYSMPRNFFDGGLIVGDSASLLNSQRLKGIQCCRGCSVRASRPQRGRWR